MERASPGADAAQLRVVEVFVELVDALVGDFDVFDQLSVLVDRCVELLGVSAAGLMLADREGRLRVMTSSSEDAQLLELWELQSDQGPCLDCVANGEVVRAPDLAATGHWPRFASRALAAGFHSMDAVPLRLRDRVFGALNLFEREPGGLDDQRLRLAQQLAQVATITLVQHRQLRRSHELVEQLQTALDTRVVLEQAKGMLAAHSGSTMEASFEALRSYARSHNRRLSEIAAAVGQRELGLDAALQGAARRRRGSGQ